MQESSQHHGDTAAKGAAQCSVKPAWEAGFLSSHLTLQPWMCYLASLRVCASHLQNADDVHAQVRRFLEELNTLTLTEHRRISLRK